MPEPCDPILYRLMARIEERRQHSPPHSYTAQLLEGGVVRIGAKIVEEATEVIEAAAEQGEPGRRHLIHEAADLIYHLLVLLGFRHISLGEVEAELEHRFDTSGLDEKESR